MAQQQLILDRYLIIDEAGSGGCGTVQHAYDTRLDRDVAIKCVELSKADAACANLLVMESRLQSEDTSPSENSTDSVNTANNTDVDTKYNFDPDIEIDSDFDIDDTQSYRPISATSEMDIEIDPDFDIDDTQSYRPISATAEMDIEIDPDFDIDDDMSASPTQNLGEPLNTFNIPRSGEATKVFQPQSDENDNTSSTGLIPNEEDASFENVAGLAEARTAAHLNDNNIVAVYDFEVHGSVAYIIMEYIEGKTLGNIMQEMGDDISLDVIAAVFNSVSHALEVAHDSDVLHLDIKPENVLVTEKGVVKVTDFGMSTLMDASGQATNGGGTIGYMPLEQMRQESLDVRTDEWALASLTYEMLTGENPFFANNLEDAERAIEDAELILPSLCWDSLDADADDVIFDALDPDPDERYESVASFAEDLTPFLGDAKAGKKVLAHVVCGDDESEEDAEDTAENETRRPSIPFIDRLGPVGAAIIIRVLSAASAALLVAASLFNVHFDIVETYNLSMEYTIVIWVILALCVVLTAIRPAIGMPVAFILFGVMLLLNQIYLLGIVLIAATVVWWILFSHRKEDICTIALIEPLAGAIGMAALAPILAGATLTIRRSVLVTVFALVSALVFASLGTTDLMNWDAVTNMFAVSNENFSGEYFTDAFITTLTSPTTWCVALSWILAAVEFSLFCERGSRAFDIAGAIVATFILLIGIIIGTGAPVVFDSLFNADFSGANMQIAWIPDPFAIAGAIIPGLIGVVLALLNVPDRARLEKDAWQKMAKSAKSNSD